MSCAGTDILFGLHLCQTSACIYALFNLPYYGMHVCKSYQCCGAETDFRDTVIRVITVIQWFATCCNTRHAICLKVQATELTVFTLRVRLPQSRTHAIRLTDRRAVLDGCTSEILHSLMWLKVCDVPEGSASQCHIGSTVMLDQKLCIEPR